MERSLGFRRFGANKRLAVIVSLLASAASAAGACTATPVVSSSNAGGAASQGAGAGTGQGQGGASDGVGSFVGSGNGSGNGSAGNGGVGGACAASSTKGKLSPLDIYIMLDQSGSMADMNKWTNCTTALKQFLQSPDSDGIGVGIQYFAVQGAVPPACQQCKDCNCIFACGCNSCSCINNVCTCSGTIDSCNVPDYATPSVEIAPLPGNAQPLISSINMHGPTSSTPTRPALEGAISHAKDWATKNVDHHVVVVLATDGEPSNTECMPNDIADVQQVAAAGFAGMPSIPTYVIGVGNSLVSLNAIAASGGTNMAFIVDAGGNTVQQFIDAMNTIRKTAGLGCEYQIPPPNDGGAIDFNQVNVQYVPGGGGPAVDILHAKDQSQCDPVSGGWYYDNNASPTKIELCPATCMKVEKDDNGEIDILLGCATKDIPPK